MTPAGAGARRFYYRKVKSRVVMGLAVVATVLTPAPLFLIVGDLLFHGDAATAKKYGVTLSKTGMACAMCHPMASDTHPYEYPKFQEETSKFATLRDMINWCIEPPVKGKLLAPDDEKLRALEAYILAQRNGVPLAYGKH